MRLDGASLGIQMAHNMASQLKPYDVFKEQLLGSNGTIAWRHHGEDLDVLIFSDYNSEDGSCCPTMFSHLTVYHFNEEHIHVCDCSMYKLLTTVAGSEALDSTGVTCMHVRFFIEIVQPNFNQIFSSNPINVGHAINKVRTSLQFISLGEYTMEFLCSST